MKAILQFDLPEESVDHLWATHAHLLAATITYTMETTRSWLKHGHQFKTPEEAIEAVRALLSDTVPLASGDVG